MAIGEKSVGTIIVFIKMIISEINVAQEPRHGNDRLSNELDRYYGNTDSQHLKENSIYGTN